MVLPSAVHSHLKMTNNVDSPKAVPHLVNVGGKHTKWININDICDFLNRDITHMSSFILDELNIEGYVDDHQHLLVCIFL